MDDAKPILRTLQPLSSYLVEQGLFFLRNDG